MATRKMGRAIPNVVKGGAKATGRRKPLACGGKLYKCGGKVKRK